MTERRGSRGEKPKPVEGGEVRREETQIYFGRIPDGFVDPIDGGISKTDKDMSVVDVEMPTEEMTGSAYTDVLAEDKTDDSGLVAAGIPVPTSPDRNVQIVVESESVPREGQTLVSQKMGGVLVDRGLGDKTSIIRSSLEKKATKEEDEREFKKWEEAGFSYEEVCAFLSRFPLDNLESAVQKAKGLLLNMNDVSVPVLFVRKYVREVRQGSRAEVSQPELSTAQDGSSEIFASDTKMLRPKTGVRGWINKILKRD